jgi:superfamily II DNA or RNA helicase
MSLRYYQAGTVRYVHDYESEIPDCRLCVYGPTGSGKTHILSELLIDPISQILFTHRRVLLDQIALVLDKRGIRYGIRASGFEPRVAPIQLAMIQSEFINTVASQRYGLHDARRVHIDEPHAIRGPVAMRVINQYHRQGASVIGYTASPVDLGGMFDDLYVSVTIPQLIAEKFLVPPVAYAIEQPDPRAIDRLKVNAKGEFSPSAVGRLVKVNTIKGRVLEAYHRLKSARGSFILYAHSVKTSIWWSQYLTAHGVPTAHIDGSDIWVDGEFFKSDTSKRREVFNAVESGRLKGLSNRFVLREGVDLPCIDHVILTCPVGSRVSIVQMCGRALRPYPDKHHAILQDHSGSLTRHPPIDRHVTWYWNDATGTAERIYLGDLRGGKEREPITCPKCCFMRYFGDTCPQCGFKYNKYCRYVQQTDGTIKLIEGKAYRPRRIVRRSGDEAAWERAYWAARKNKSTRTFEQIYTFYAVSHNWQWLPRDLPLMPLDSYSWFRSVGDVSMSELIPRES